MVRAKDRLGPDVPHEVDEVSPRSVLSLKLREPQLKAQSFRVNVVRDHGGPFRFGLQKILPRIAKKTKGGPFWMDGFT
jgi:hypothetical protein